MSKTNWTAVAAKDARGGKEPWLPTERELSAGEKVFGMLIPGLNIAIAADALSNDHATPADDREYMAVYSAFHRCSAK